MGNTGGILKTNSKPVQVYQRVGGPKSSLMARAFMARENGYLLIGEPVTMSYDHRDHQVVPLLNVDEGHFIMLSDAEEATVVNEKSHVH